MIYIYLYVLLNYYCKQKSVTKRKFIEANMTKFKQLLNDEDFSETLNTDCLDSAYEKFFSLYET